MGAANGKEASQQSEAPHFDIRVRRSRSARLSSPSPHCRSDKPAAVRRAGRQAQRQSTFSRRAAEVCGSSQRRHTARHATPAHALTTGGRSAGRGGREGGADAAAVEVSPGVAPQPQELPRFQNDALLQEALRQTVRIACCPREPCLCAHSLPRRASATCC